MHFTIRDLLWLTVVVALVTCFAPFTHSAFGWPRWFARCKRPNSVGQRSSVAELPNRARNEWTNSLQMKFVPLGALSADRQREVFVATTEVTVAQFTSFV